MNVKITYNTDFLAGVHWDEHFLMNNYYVTVDMLTNTADTLNQNIALSRIRHVMEEQLQDCYFVNLIDAAAIEQLQLAGIKFSELPEQPVDQIVGMILFAKFSAVAEQQLLIQSVKVSSVLGDRIIYEHSKDDKAAFTSDAWWNSASPYCSDIDTPGYNNSICLVNGTKRWRELGMHWNQQESLNSEVGNVLIFDEHRNDQDDA